MIWILRILVEFSVHDKSSPDLQEIRYVLNAEEVNIRPAPVIVQLQALLTSPAKRQRQQSLILNALLFFQRNVVGKIIDLVHIGSCVQLDIDIIVFLNDH